jgi:ubiquinone/menaquinone biosynthesis C-methylase UbiE
MTDRQPTSVQAQVRAQSRRMVHEAHTRAQTLGRHTTAFCQADAEALPFSHDACDLITSKLAFHYFPHPQAA